MSLYWSRRAAELFSIGQESKRCPSGGGCPVMIWQMRQGLSMVCVGRVLTALIDALKAYVTSVSLENGLG